MYWPGEFADVMRQLTGHDASGRQAANALFQFNTGALALAAAVGVVNNRKREVGTDKKEISTHSFGSHGLEDYIFLVPLIGSSEATVNQLRPEHEEEAIREFERFAAGGLEVLRAELASAPTQTPDFVLEDIITRSAGTLRSSEARPRLI